MERTPKTIYGRCIGAEADEQPKTSRESYFSRDTLDGRRSAQAHLPKLAGARTGVTVVELFATLGFTSVINHAKLIQPDDGRSYFHARASVSADRAIYAAAESPSAGTRNTLELVGLRPRKSIHRRQHERIEYERWLVFAVLMRAVRAARHGRLLARVCGRFRASEKQ